MLYITFNPVLGCNLKNYRMISVRFQGKPFNTTVIQDYAPTSNTEEAEVEQFYEDLKDLLELTPPKDVLFIIGDWKAKVGSQETPRVIGKFGLGAQNEAGQRLIEFCQENALVIANTLSQQHKRQLTSDGHHQMVNTKIRLIYSLQPKMDTAKTRPGADCGSDHELLIAKFRLKLNKVEKALDQIPYDYTVEVTNRCKGLGQIDRVPDKLWMEVCDTVQETGIRPSPWQRNAKKAKWLSEKPLQITVKRRKAKSKGEKERYSHLNAEFQRIARRDKKAFLSNQCKEIEENNRMGKTRDLFKKIRDTKGTFHAKMGSIKDRNGMDLTEAEDRSRRY